MVDHVEIEAQARSSVKIEQNSKGFGQVKISVYMGETEASMQPLIDLAVNAYETTLRQLGTKAQQQ